MESDKFDTFQQLCVAKPNLATEVIITINSIVYFRYFVY